jgi:hypothetical protein
MPFLSIEITVYPVRRLLQDSLLKCLRFNVNRANQATDRLSDRSDSIPSCLKTIFHPDDRDIFYDVQLGHSKILMCFRQRLPP